MIRHFYIDNFKSLVDFSLPPKPERLGKFTCLIGMNGTGKSTVLQAFDFIKQLTHGRMDDWLAARDWKQSDLASHFQPKPSKRLITFCLVFEFHELGKITWEGYFNPYRLRCTKESIKLGDLDVLKFVDGVLTYSSHNIDERIKVEDLNFQGSVLSALLLDKAYPAIRLVRDFVRDLKSLDMLAPNLMRKRSRDAEDVGYGGERLSAFLSGFSIDTWKRLDKLLKHFYPNTQNVWTYPVQGGWQELIVTEQYSSKHYHTYDRQLNDGMLRILAILSQLEAKDKAKDVVRLQQLSKTKASNKKHIKHHEYRALLFDEIENGIHPELIEKLVAYLLEANQQIIVTTHSPMILNYLPDEVAKEAVILLYRTDDGIARSVRYFDLPSAKRKLDLLGPGEVFVDTDFSVLTLEAEALRGAA